VGTALFAGAWTVYGANGPAEHRSTGASRLRLSTPDDLSPPIPLPAGEKGITAPDWRALLSNHRLILLTLSYAAVGYVEYLFFFWMHYYFEKVLHLGTSASRFYAAVLYLAMAVGMVLGGWAADRLARTQGTLRGRALVVVVGLCTGGVLLVL